MQVEISEQLFGGYPSVTEANTVHDHSLLCY